MLSRVCFIIGKWNCALLTLERCILLLVEIFPIRSVLRHASLLVRELSIYGCDEVRFMRVVQAQSSGVLFLISTLKEHTMLKFLRGVHYSLKHTQEGENLSDVPQVRSMINIMQVILLGVPSKLPLEGALFISMLL